MKTVEIKERIQNKIAAHFEGDETYIDLLSGDIQKEFGIKDATPTVCGAMRAIAEIYSHQIIETPYKGKGTRLKIRYYKDADALVSDGKIETIVRQPKGASGDYTRSGGSFPQIIKVDPNVIMENTFNFYNEIIKDPNGRFKSWEHCYNFFKANRNQIDADILDRMSLHLAFYLASWGMLRGSAFLLQKDYLVHLPAIKIMLESKYELLWGGETEKLSNAVNLLIECGERISESYQRQPNCKKPSQTLLTKILLGVYGCVPAYDRYFIEGLKKYGLTAMYGKRSLGEVLQFYTQYREKFEDNRERISQNGGADYTPMKLMDMFFWMEGVNQSGATIKEALDSEGENR